MKIISCGVYSQICFVAETIHLIIAVQNWSHVACSSFANAKVLSSVKAVTALK